MKDEVKAFKNRMLSFYSGLRLSVAAPAQQQVSTA
jgi:hypothetical protein